MGKPGRDKFRSAFGAALSEQMATRKMTQSDLARATGRTPAYINHLVTGRKPASAEWVSLIAEAMKLSRVERAKLTVSAVVDLGYSREDIESGR